MNLQALFIAGLLCLIVACRPPMIPNETGVSYQLAEWRKATISDLHYELSFEIPASRDEAISSELILTCHVSDTRNGLTLDYKEATDKLHAIEVNGETSNVDHQNEHLLIPASSLQKGTNEVRIRFTAGNLSLNRNDAYLYTLLVPDRARTMFPVFDQPDLKARWTLHLEVPKHWSAVANGAATVAELGSTRQYHFSSTHPISTYLFAFAAGEFRQLTDPQSGMKMYYRETDDEKVARNADEIFALHRQSLSWLEEYTDIEFPFEKFDFALIPGFQYGGMEHPGAIWYRESSLFLEETATINQRLRRASLIAHETAHMWFGNLVTMSWFSDVWLKEVFANLMAAKIVHPSFPEVNHELNFLLDHYPAAYAVDRTAGTHPIQQDLPNLELAGTLYGAIIYEKAPIVMRNLETMMGAEAFQMGIQEYLRTYSYGNATWDDLIGILDQQTEQDLTHWDRDWVKRGGMPEMDLKTSGEGEATKIHLSVLNSSNGQYWPQTINLFQSMKPEDSLVVQVSGSSNTYPLPKGLPVGDFLLPNTQGRTYGHISVNHTTRLVMLRGATRFDDLLGRASLWLGLWEAMLRQEITPDELLEFAIPAIESEENPLILSYILGRVSSLFWQFIPPSQRETYTRGIEGALIRRFLSEKDLSVKRSLYESLIRLAWTEDGKRTILRIWQGRWEAFDLPLSESDYVNLAFEMAVRDMPEAPEILIQTKERLKNPDRQKRMEFIMPAVSLDQGIRDAFFESLQEIENRSHEPWVGTSLSYLHHPLRAESSRSYLPKSLEMIEEIQRTGDIFFPANWLQRTLGRYQSPKEAQVVRQFLDTHPDLAPNLKNKILQAADGLFRAAEIVKRSD